MHVQVLRDVSGTSFAEADGDRQLLRPSSQQLHASLEGVALPLRRQASHPLKVTFLAKQNMIPTTVHCRVVVSGPQVNPQRDSLLPTHAFVLSLPYKAVHLDA